MTLAIFSPASDPPHTNTRNQAAPASSGAGVSAPTPRGSLPNSLDSFLPLRDSLSTEFRPRMITPTAKVRLSDGAYSLTQHPFCGGSP
jgi:hypothetical protein